MKLRHKVERNISTLRSLPCPTYLGDSTKFSKQYKQKNSQVPYTPHAHSSQRLTSSSTAPHKFFNEKMLFDHYY